MSDYSDGYDEGFEDGSSGEPPQTNWPDIFAIIDTDSQADWVRGYNEGYQAGKEEFEADSG